MGKKALTLHMDETIVDDFRHYCQLNALKLSAKVELILKKEMETAHSNPTLVRLFEDILKKQSFKNASRIPEQKKIEKENNSCHKDKEDQEINEQTTEKQDKESLVPEKTEKTDNRTKKNSSIHRPFKKSQRFMILLI